MSYINLYGRSAGQATLVAFGFAASEGGARVVVRGLECEADAFQVIVFNVYCSSRRGERREGSGLDPGPARVLRLRCDNGPLGLPRGSRSMVAGLLKVDGRFIARLEGSGYPIPIANGNNLHLGGALHTDVPPPVGEPASAVWSSAHIWRIGRCIGHQLIVSLSGGLTCTGDRLREQRARNRFRHWPRCRPGFENPCLSS